MSGYQEVTSEWSFERHNEETIVIRNGENWTCIQKDKGPIYEKFLYRFCEQQSSRTHESDLLAALKAITNSGPDAIPIKEAFEMAHRAIELANGGKV